jgi:hypothetical protein
MSDSVLMTVSTLGDAYQECKRAISDGLQSSEF